jgi:LemA protein
MSMGYEPLGQENAMKRTLLAAVAVMSLYGCGYNTIQTMDEQVNGYKSQIQVQLQRRNDLIPNLVSVVQKFAAHESTVYIGVAEARSKMAGAVTGGNLQEMAAANQGMGQALGRLLAVAEAYPQLKSDANFRSLQDQLEGTENRIATAREDYNNAVRTYNAYIRKFPQVLTAKMIGSKARDYFQAQAGAEKAPNVDSLMKK